MSRINIYILFLCCCIPGMGCKKFLDGKTNKKYEIPTNTADLQSILAFEALINYTEPGNGEGSADNFYMKDDIFNSLGIEDQGIYLWADNNVFTKDFNDWSYLYDNVNRANTILDFLSSGKIIASNGISDDYVKGEALFLRGKTFRTIADMWTVAYDSVTAGSDPGIPLRLTSDFNIKSVRATNQETYLRIIKDLQEAASLLPLKSINPVLACKQSAWGMLARTYLAMRNYKQAGMYADSVLAVNSQLLDFNTIDLTNFYSLPPLNVEDVYESGMSIGNFQYPGVVIVDSVLYNSYEPNDLRKPIFYTQNADTTFSFFGGSYSLTYYKFFTGIATDEMYLVSAECNARQGNTQVAMNELNTLLKARYKTGTYTDKTAATPNDATAIILTERRKELVMRGLRWGDIKRLNKSGANITQVHKINGSTYTLLPNSPRYALPIPDDVIAISGMEQNKY